MVDAPSANSARTGLRRHIALVLIAGALATFSLLTCAPHVGAQGTYGDSAYGTELYSTETSNAAEGTEPTVGAPNTGFEAVTRAATEQPALFWGSIGALLLALGLGGALAWKAIRRTHD